MERRLIIIQGDITLLPLKEGAIINPSNSGLLLTERGVGPQLKRRAGPFIQQSLHIERSKLRGARLESGQVLATDAGQLQAKKLIHIAIVGGRKVNKRLVSRGLLNAYELADELGMRTLGVPPVGPGISKIEMEDFFDLFWKVTLEEFPTFDNIDTIYMCLDNAEDFAAAKEWAEKQMDKLPESVTVEINEAGISLGMFSAQFLSQPS